MSFFGSVIGFIKNVLKLIALIFKVIFNPTKYFSVLLLYVIGLAIYVAYLISLPFAMVLAPVLTYLVIIAFDLLRIAGWIALFAVMIVPVIVIWILDIVLRGRLMALARCENLPDSWIWRPGYALNNKYQRNVLCSYPCSSNRFAPQGVLWASSLPPDEPGYCAHQLIVAAAEQGRIPDDAGPIVMKFTPGINFWKLGDKDKENIARDFVKRKHKYLATCYKTFKEAETMSKVAENVCKNLAVFFDPTSDTYVKVRSLCDEVFCNYMYDNNTREARPRAPSERPAFCQETTDVIPQLLSGDASKLAERLILAVSAILVLAFVAEAMRRALGISSLRTALRSM